MASPFPDDNDIMADYFVSFVFVIPFVISLLFRVWYCVVLFICCFVLFLPQSFPTSRVLKSGRDNLLSKNLSESLVIFQL